MPSVAFNPIGLPFDLVNKQKTRFSVKRVLKKTIVAETDEMLLLHGLDVEAGLDVFGSIEFVLGDGVSDGFSWQSVPDAEVLYVPRNRVMHFSSGFDISGGVVLEGALEAIA